MSSNSSGGFLRGCLIAVGIFVLVCFIGFIALFVCIGAIAGMVGESTAAPAVVIVSRSGAKLTLGNRTWKATNTKKLKVKNQKVTGLKTGSTKLTTTVIGTKVTVPVSVVKGKAGAPEEGQRADLVTIDDYNVPLGDGELFLLEDDECFEYVE